MNLFWLYCLFIILLFFSGLYCIFFTYNLIRALIGFELLIKAVTLLLVLAGNTNHQLALAQGYVLTLIVIEVAIIAVAVGIVIGLHQHHQSLDTRQLRQLKG